MASSSGIVKKESTEKDSEFLCETCKEGGIFTEEASFFCRTCGLCYCNKCCICGHDVLGSSNKQLWNKGTQARDHQLCARHPKELVKIYCQRHDQICCEICLSTVHRFCVEMTELKGIKDVIASKQDVDKVKTGLSGLQTKIEVLQRDRVTRTNTIETSFNKSLDRVGQFRRKANAAFDDIETNLSKYRRTYLDRFAGDQAINRNMLQMVTAYKTEIENSDGQGTVFDVKSCNDWVFNSSTTLASMNGSLIKDYIVPIHDDKVTNIVREIAELSEVYITFPDFPILAEGDTVECMVGDICQMPDGSFILTDTANKKLKKLDRLYQIVEHYQMDAEPRGLCCVNEKEVAVAMSNKTVKLVSVGDKMNILQSFTLDCNYDVIGVAATCQKLYTVSLDKRYNPTYVHFIIYDRIGDEIKLLNNTKSNFRSRNMTATTDGSRFYLAFDDEIVTTNKQGQTLSTKKIENGSGECVDEYGYEYDSEKKCVDEYGYEYDSEKKTTYIHRQPLATKEIMNGSCVCVDESNNVYVSKSGKNQILKLNKNCELVSVVVKETDGFTDPGALCFDKNAGRLIVAKKKGDFIYLV